MAFTSLQSGIAVKEGERSLSDSYSSSLLTTRAEKQRTRVRLFICRDANRTRCNLFKYLRQMEIKDFVSVEERILQLVRKADEIEWENNSWVILGEPTPTENVRGQAERGWL